MFLSLFSLILANKFIQIETIGHGFSLTHGPGIANGNHNYMTKYGIPMNLRSQKYIFLFIKILILITSHEMLAHLEWTPKRRQKRSISSMEEQLAIEDGLGAKNNCSDEHHILAHLLDGYDKFKIPGGGNLRVEVEVIIKIYKIVFKIHFIDRFGSKKCQK
jgi:hypothetical protein